MNTRFACRLVALLALLALLSPALGLGEEPKTLIVENAGAALPETPLVVAVADNVREEVYDVKLGNSNEYQFAQFFKENGKTYLAVILPSIAPGKNVLSLEPHRHIRSVAGANFHVQGPNVEIRVLGTVFTELHTDMGPKPILYPLIGPQQARFTRDFPMKDVAGEDKDHPHHRSFWFTHGQVNGVDFWSEAKGHGTIRQTAILSKIAGEAVGILRTSDDWIGPNGKKICEDERTLRVYPTHDSRMFDYEVTIKATDGPVTFGDTKEGMFGMRLASSMDVTRKTGGKIVNAEGITDAAAWGKASPWVDYSGPIDGKTVGVAIFDHPTSFRHPTTWHVRDYGLFAANPFGWHDFGLKKSGDYTVPAGGSITFKYRVVLHEGDAKAAGIADAYRAYATPLKVEVK